MDCDELYISFLFPPHDYVSGITVFKRIMENENPVDVLHADLNVTDEAFDNNPYINDKIKVDVDCGFDEPECILKSVKKAIPMIKKEYKKIYSRSWLMQNHFLALKYKFRNPNVFWSAEFSDPLIYNVSNKVRNNSDMNLDNQAYIDELNHHISELDGSFPLIENNSSIFFIAEYVTYLFADRIIFTNENQRKVMLDQFPIDITDFIMDKSEIMMHPTLGDEFYHLKDADLGLDDEFINIAYFGRDYYGQRHFESLFYSIESLNHKFKDRIRIYLFIENKALLKKLIRPLESSDNFIIKKPLEYFKFLNATTQFDVLIVNDVVTKDVWPVNPYLPSKLSDYLGSSRDIWAFYEDGSTLSKADLKYKSCINDYDSCRDELVRILDDYGFADEDCSFDDDYFLKRLTSLNKMVDFEFNARSNLKKENKILKKSNEEILSSNSWKLTKPLRKFRNR